MQRNQMCGCGYLFERHKIKGVGQFMKGNPLGQQLIIIFIIN